MSIPRELVEQFAQGNGAIFVGAGLAMGAGLPGWRDLAKSFASELEDVSFEDSIFQDIAQYYENEYKRNRLITRLRDELDTNTHKPTTVHEALAKFPCNMIFVTYFDDLLEQALETAKRNPNRVTNNADPNFWSNDILQLVNLNGELKQPKTIVITNDDYHKHYTLKHSALTQLVEIAFTTRTVLLLGYHPADPDFRQLLAQARSDTDLLTRNAFAVFLNIKKGDKKNLESKEIRVIDLNIAEASVATEAKKNKLCNEALTTWLEELHKRVQAEKKRRDKQSIPHSQIPPSEPYKFLDFFTEKDTGIFHGREYATERLISLIIANRLSILYGESGTGKTSLLMAMVLPRLRSEDFYIAYARPRSDLFKEVESAIGAALPVAPLSNQEITTLRSIVENRLPKAGRLLIVLDQFEELFTRQGPEVRKAFISQLVELIDISEREVRCLLSLRSDYLDRLDELESYIRRDPLQYRMRLYNLGQDEASAAIRNPALACEINLEHELLEQLLKDLEQEGIAPSQLQIVCYELWRDWQKQGEPQCGLTLNRYRDLGEAGAILAGYLDDVVKELEQPKVRNEYNIQLDGPQAQEAVRIVLKSMITAERTKVSATTREITQRQIIARRNLTLEQVDALTTYLRNRRIIRHSPDSDSYELAHEVMIEKVWQWVDEKELHILDLEGVLDRATSDYRKSRRLLLPDTLTHLADEAERLSLKEDALELLLVSAVEHNLDPVIWVNKMKGDQAVKALAELLKLRQRRLYAQIAKALGHTKSPIAIRYLQDLLKDEGDDVQRVAADALGKLGLPGVVKPLYFAVMAENNLVRAARILGALETLHTEETASMLTLVAAKHQNKHVRNRAFIVLQNSGFSKSISLTARLLNSDGLEIRQSAFDIVKRVLDENSSEFVAMLRDPDVQIQLHAIEALKAIGDPQKAHLLLEVLWNDNVEIQQRAVDAFMKLGSIEQLMSILPNQSNEVQRRIAIALKQLVGLEQLLTALSHENLQIREGAAILLGQLGDEQAIKPLLLALQGENAQMRRSVVTALKQLAGMDFLIMALCHEEAQVRRGVALSLGVLEDEQAVEPLLKALDDTDTKVRWAAMQALGFLWKFSLLEQLGSERVKLRRKAASLLGQQRDMRAVEPLVATLQDEDFKVRQSAASALGQLGDARAVTSLLERLQDESSEMRRSVVCVLGQLKDVRAVEPLLLTLRDDNAEVRQGAANALGQLRDIRAVKPLLEILRDTNSEVRGSAASALGQLGALEAVEPLIERLQDENAEVRCSAANALGELGDERAVEPLLRLLSDQDTEMQRRASIALKQLSGAERLLVALRHEEAKIRQGAAISLGDVGDERAVEPLLQAVHDKDSRVRWAAMQALGFLWKFSLLEQLGSESVQLRQKAASVLGQQRDMRAVEPLVATLQDEDFKVRQSAASALGQLGDTRAVNPLLERLQDESSEMRRSVVCALGQLRDVRAVEPLLLTLRDGNAEVRQGASSSLGQLRDIRAVKPLLETLRDTNFEVRRNAASALGQLGALEAVEPLIERLQDENAEVRRSAVNALGELGDERTVEPLLRLLSDQDMEVQRRASIALKQLSGAERLLVALRHEEAKIRQGVAKALGRLGYNPAVRPLLVTLHDTDIRVRWAAMQALGLLWKVPLLERLGSDSAPLRQEAAITLGQQREKRFMELLVATLQDEDVKVRQRAVVALGYLSDVRAVKPLLERLRDESAEVRRSAASALGELGDSSAVEPLIERLRDESAEVRRSAASALGQLGALNAVEPLIERLRDESAEVRRSAASALGQLRALNTVEPLIERLRDESAEVRRSAASVLGELGDSSAIEPLIERLRDESAEVRRSAAITLGQLRALNAVEPLIERLQDENAEVRHSAANALGQLGDLRAIDPLIDSLNDENAGRDAKVQWAVMKALGALWKLPLLDQLGSESAQERRKAANTLGELGDGRGVAPLLATLRDENAEVRRIAANALGQIGDGVALETLIERLCDENAEVRRSVVNALGQLGDKRAVEPLLKALQDENVEVQRNAISALEQLGDRRAVEPLRALLGDQDTEVRRRAAIALERI